MLGKSDSYVAVVSKAIAAAASSVTDNSVRLLLAGTPIASAAVIAAPALAAVASAVIEQLGKQNSEIEKKLDKILAEPLAFARATLTENLSIKPSSDVEIQERERQLTTAYDKLRTAYIYADEEQHAAQTMIQLYQAFVAALMIGGKPYVERYIQIFQKAAAIARNEAELSLAEAREIDPEWFNRHRSEVVMWAVDYSDYYNRETAVDRSIDDAREKKQTLERNAAELIQDADRLDACCRLLDRLAKNTAEALANRALNQKNS
jgi:hypothetical protein